MLRESLASAVEVLPAEWEIEAVKLLQARGVRNFEVRLTIDGTENRYARWLKRRFGQLPNLRFLGLQSHDRMLEHYKEGNALLFPSRLETWGLPITEAKQHQLPMLVAEVPYAHETVGEYDLVSFFDPQNPAGSFQVSGAERLLYTFFTICLRT